MHETKLPFFVHAEPPYAILEACGISARGTLMTATNREQSAMSFFHGLPSPQAKISTKGPRFLATDRAVFLQSDTGDTCAGFPRGKAQHQSQGHYEMSSGVPYPFFAPNLSKGT